MTVNHQSFSSLVIRFSKTITQKNNIRQIQIPSLIIGCYHSSLSSLLFCPLRQRTIGIDRLPKNKLVSSNKFLTSTTTTTKTETIMAKTVEEALRLGNLVSDGQTYTFLKFPISAVAQATTLVSKSSHFRGLLVDKDEITIMVPLQDYQNHKNDTNIMIAVDADDNTNNTNNADANDPSEKVEKESVVEVGQFMYRMITFDAVLDPNLIGFMATITKALAKANISVLPFAAYSRDHIFVQEGDFDKAMQVLTNLANDNTK